jgi:L-ascorbate metabolism protein UlaG (beta-lactamase superfamily)
MYFPLHIAVRRGNSEFVRLCLESGANVEGVEADFNCTPLQIAAIRGQADIARLLIEHGADIEGTGRRERSPLYYAARYGNKRVAEVLRAAGARAIETVPTASSTYLNRDVPVGEAAVWHLGHSGWAVKTANNFLVFDYYRRDHLPDKPCLDNGHIEPEELVDQTVTVFSSHEHGDHYDSSIFVWRETDPNITYILGHEPNDVDGYTHIPPRQTRTIGDLNVQTIHSTDAGVGYLVEVDGLTIFHAGDHSNGEIGLHAEYTDEIDYLATTGVAIDLAFLPISGCSLGTPETVKEGVRYALEKLRPSAFFPQHNWNSEFRYREFEGELREAGFDLPVACADNCGDCFYYRDKSIM